MIQKLLIANRGEIARRIARTCRRLGIATVGIYSESEHGHPHTLEVDEAVLLGSDLKSSYLDIDRILNVAKAHSVDAIHPGYGFLSENPNFAERVISSGIRFVGPSPETMRLFGHKHTARAVAKNAGVPVAEGYEGEEQGEKILVVEANRVGFPLMIKAVAGGGGRGMRFVESAAGFVSALQSAKREAAAAFGDDRILLERVINRGRHIEVQLIGDGKGKVLHCFERDCSVQRRYQKVLEESPAPGISPTVRSEICNAAVRLGESVKLENATTVEFMFVEEGDQSRFYFLEANTRLQVEHPVTEEVTGLDLVELQLRIAAGESLGLSQRDIEIKGHSIEARIYAENPAQGFIPTTGTIRRIRLPELESVRLESGIAEGMEVSTNFDPMLLKVVATGPNREISIALLDRALEGFAVEGVTTNTLYLQSILRSPEFRVGGVTTNFLGEFKVEHRVDESVVIPRAIAAMLFAQAHRSALCFKGKGFDPFSMRNYFRQYRAGTVRGFRLTAPRLQLAIRSKQSNLTENYPAQIVEGDIEGPCRVGLKIDVNGTIYSVKGEVYNGASGLPEVITINGEQCTVGLSFERANHQSLVGAEIWIAGLEFEVEAPGSAVMGGVGRDEHDVVVSPLPGNVTKIEVNVGDSIELGQRLLVIESMKMEHMIVAPRSGVVESVDVRLGDNVKGGGVLMNLRQDRARPASD